MGTSLKVLSARVRISHKLQGGTVLPDIKEKVFAINMIEQWKKGPTEVMNSPSSETQKIQNPTNTALSSLL